MACIDSKIARVDKISAQISKICRVDIDYYLKVSPNDISWVSEDIEAILSVESNTKWNIN